MRAELHDPGVVSSCDGVAGPSLLTLRRRRAIFGASLLTDAGTSIQGRPGGTGIQGGQHTRQSLLD